MRYNSEGNPKKSWIVVRIFPVVTEGRTVFQWAEMQSTARTDRYREPRSTRNCRAGTCSSESVGAPCETKTAGITSGTIVHYLDDALDFKKDIRADDGIWFDIRDLILFFKDRGFSKNGREIYQKIINPGLNNVALSA
jgi:hypothetical protein